MHIAKDHCLEDWRNPAGPGHDASRLTFSVFHTHEMLLRGELSIRFQLDQGSGRRSLFRRLLL